MKSRDGIERTRLQNRNPIISKSNSNNSGLIFLALGQLFDAQRQRSWFGDANH